MQADSNPCIEKGRLIVIHVLAGIVMAGIFGLIFGYFVMLLWNHLMPEIFGLREITFWQGSGLVIMCRLLFGTCSYGKYGEHAHPYHNEKKRNEHQNWWDNEGKEELKKYIEERNLENK
jgi:uncharacterized membrane protein YraQ (UPF0718 family)